MDTKGNHVFMSLTRTLRYKIWELNGYIGPKHSLNIPEKATVIVTYYNPARLKHIEPQIRNILKCDFVEKVVISSHNPDVHMNDKLCVKDQRLVFLNQEVKRGCGHRWFVAKTFEPEYLIVIDDDLLLFPWQLAKVFTALVSEPEVPHGLAGMSRVAGDSLIYLESVNADTDYLCEMYAVTIKHLKRYLELRQMVAQDETTAKLVDSAMDFMVISHTGAHRPKIHRVGRIFRCETFKQTRVAVHKTAGFDEGMIHVSKILSTVTVQTNQSCEFRSVGTDSVQFERQR